MLWFSATFAVTTKLLRKVERIKKGNTYRRSHHFSDTTHSTYDISDSPSQQKQMAIKVIAKFRSEKQIGFAHWNLICINVPLLYQRTEVEFTSFSSVGFTKSQIISRSNVFHHHFYLPEVQIRNDHAVLNRLNAATGGKAAKAWTLARFWGLESGGGSGTPAKWPPLWLPCLPKIYCGGPEASLMY